jgi:hypothetical protein
MAQSAEKSITFRITSEERPDFKHPLVLYLFDTQQQLKQRVEVKEGKAELALPPGGLGHMRLFVAPFNERLDAKATPARLERMGAYEPVLHVEGRLESLIDIPGSLIDIWPFCFCRVRGRVVRNDDNRPICHARVHICEVDRIPFWIDTLPDHDLFHLRDDLLAILRLPPVPDPDPGPLRLPLRFAQPAPSKAAQAMNDIALQMPGMPAGLPRMLRNASSTHLRAMLRENWTVLIPWFCYWPHWWHRLRCDEMAVVETDGSGHFDATLIIPCHGDQPDLYFWVEFNFGAGYETVYRPAMACHTYWNYHCGGEVTIRITDPRVPSCDPNPDLAGCQLIFNTIGSNITVNQLQTSGTEGTTLGGAPLGGTLEMRVDFSRTTLIAMGIPYYQWSYRRLTGPNGTSTVAAPGSVPLNDWRVMTHAVYRYYRDGDSYPSEPMGPVPAVGPSPENLFRIQPANPPSASGYWYEMSEHIDKATAYFETDILPGAPRADAVLAEDLAAGLYEVKLELFDSSGARVVDWDARHIDLRVMDQPAGAPVLTTSSAPEYNRVREGGQTCAFRMVLRVDNNRCAADILPVDGGVSPDPECGFHLYTGPDSQAHVSFLARHPNHFATFTFQTTRAATSISSGAADTTGRSGDAAGTHGFTQGANFVYGKDVTVSEILGECDNAAFSEALSVQAWAVNGYGQIYTYDAHDHAAFALAKPCPTCS